jgi:putative redox protein
MRNATVRSGASKFEQHVTIGPHALQMYAARKAWPLTGVKVDVRLEKTADGTVFHRSIELEGGLDGTQRERLLEIANKCPVHATLSGKIQIATKLS